MYKGKTIAVVMPAYNEQTQIVKALRSIPDWVDRIVVVDDASADGTGREVTHHAASDPRVLLIRHDVNQGVGGAIASGYAWCRDHDVAAAVVMAGDAQMDPADLPDLLDPLVEGRADYTKGNRLVTGDAYRIIPKVRYFGNMVLSLLTKIASGYWHVADSQCGYTAINLRALKTLDWSAMYKRYGQPNDLLVRLNVYNFRVCDVPVRPVYNVGEKSGIHIHRVIFTIGRLLVRLFFWRMKEKYIVRDFHPLVFFYALGLFMFIVNLGFAMRLIALWIAFGHVPEITFLVWLFSFATGLMSTFFAMFFDMENGRSASR